MECDVRMFDMMRGGVECWSEQCAVRKRDPKRNRQEVSRRLRVRHSIRDNVLGNVSEGKGAAGTRMSGSRWQRRPLPEGV